MPHRLSRTRFIMAGALIGLVASCGGGSGTGDLDKIQVTMSQFEISVMNTSGRALFDVRTEIEPAGPASHFTNTIARMENGEKRSIAHNTLTDRDYVPFSPRNVKVKGVIVTAKDIDGKTFRVEMPFKM